MENLSIIATLTIISGIISLVCLLLLHFLSPEFKASWRMVSEYALGKHKKFITAFFIFWSVASILCACLTWNMATTNWAKFGAVLVFITGIGALMGGMFDVKHKLHGLAFFLGIPFLPIGALLISYNLIKNKDWSNHQPPVLISAHFIWISLVLMALSMMLLFSGFKKAGVAFGPNIEPPKTLPNSVIGINGYFNRFLILCYIGWVIVIAKTYLSLQ
jgi:hypothetical protein